MSLIFSYFQLVYKCVPYSLSLMAHTGCIHASHPSLVARVGEEERRDPTRVVDEDHLGDPLLLAPRLRLGRRRRRRPRRRRRGEEDSRVARLEVGRGVPRRQVLREYPQSERFVELLKNVTKLALWAR